MTITFGLDISHHQDKALDLAAARRDGCEFVFLKAGEGDSFVDPDFASNLAEAHGAGQLVAAYWYQRANATAAAHVATLATVVPSGVPVILDVEAGSGGVALTRDILDRLRSARYTTPVLYLPRWYWQQVGSPSLAGLPPLWSSRYPDNTVGLLPDEWARVPASYWDGYGGLDVAVLQFTSSARIAGYQPLDASAFRGTRDELAALFHQEDTMALTDQDVTKIFWGTKFDGQQNFAQYLKGHVDSLTAQNGALLGLVQKGTTVTADQLAAALQPGLVTAVLPALQSAVAEALGADNAAQATEVANQVIANLAAKLAAQPVV